MRDYYIVTIEFLRYLLRKTKPRLAFDKSMNREQFLDWQQKVREKVREIYAIPSCEEPIKAKCLWTKPRESYQLKKLEIYTEKGNCVPSYLLIPDSVSEKKTLLQL